VVAYSVRKIASTANLCMRVRRDNDNDELDIGFRGENMDTSALLAFVGSNNGYVVRWYDQVGSNDAYQTDAGDQPRIVAAGTLVEINGRPALRLEGDGLEIAYFDYFPVGNFTQMYHISVTQADGAGAQAGLRHYGIPSNQRSWFLQYYNDSGTDRMRAILSENGSGLRQFIRGTFNVNTQYLHEMQLDMGNTEANKMLLDQNTNALDLFISSSVPTVLHKSTVNLQITGGTADVFLQETAFWLGYQSGTPKQTQVRESVNRYYNIW